MLDLIGLERRTLIDTPNQEENCTAYEIEWKVDAIIPIIVAIIGMVWDELL